MIQIKINKEWYYLCACKNCGEVHALHPDKYLDDVDNKRQCCDKPDNWMTEEYSPVSYKAIQVFMKDNPNEKYRDVPE